MTGDLTFPAMGTEVRLIGRGVERARRWVERYEATLSWFRPASELSRLNGDRRERVPASPTVCVAIAAALWAARLTDGLVTPTLDDRWRDVRVDGGHVVRPRGVAFDLGATAKGLAADRLAAAIGGVADCGGDVAVAGTHVVHGPGGPYRISRGAVATSGTDRRGAHVVDPRTGAPARPAHVTATALAPTALEAEARATAALITGDPAWLAHGGALA